MAGGVTTVEIKSGYGLDIDTELKMLRAAGVLAKTEKVRIERTLLALHALPPEFVGRREFPNRCFAVGTVMVAAGLIADLLLFVRWVGGDPSPPNRLFGLASFAQTLIIAGGTVAMFGIVSRFLRARAARERGGGR